ncbi:MAG: hypothetical protein RR906_04595 [Acetivibrio sp.]
MEEINNALIRKNVMEEQNLDKGRSKGVTVEIGGVNQSSMEPASPPEKIETDTHKRSENNFVTKDGTMRIFKKDAINGSTEKICDVDILTRGLINESGKSSEENVKIETIRNVNYSTKDGELTDVSLPEKIKVIINGKPALMEGLQFTNGKLSAERIVDESTDGYRMEQISFQSGNIIYKSKHAEIHVPSILDMGDPFHYDNESGELHVEKVAFERKFLEDVSFGPPPFAFPMPLDFANISLEFSPILEASVKLSAECSNIKGLSEKQDSPVIDLGFKGEINGKVGLGAQADLNLQLPGTAYISGAPKLNAGLWGELASALQGDVAMNMSIQKRGTEIKVVKDMDFDVNSKIQLIGTAGFHAGGDLLIWKGDFIKVTFGEWIMAEMNAGGQFSKLKEGGWEMKNSFFDASVFEKTLYENNNEKNAYGIAAAEEKLASETEASYENVIAFAKDSDTINVLKGNPKDKAFVKKVEELNLKFSKTAMEARENLDLMLRTKELMDQDPAIKKRMEKLQKSQFEHQSRLVELESWEDKKQKDGPTAYEQYKIKYGNGGFEGARRKKLEEQAKSQIMNLDEMIKYEAIQLQKVMSGKKALKHKQRILELQKKKNEQIKEGQKEPVGKVNANGNVSKNENPKKDNEKQQMMDLYKGQLKGGKALLKHVREHPTPAMLLKYEEKRKTEVTKKHMQIKESLEAYIDVQKKKKDFKLDKPNEEVYEYYKSIGGTAGKAILAKNSRMDKAVNAEDIIRYEREKVEKNKNYEKHQKRIIWLENMVKIRNNKAITDEKVVELYKKEQGGKKFEKDALSRATTENLIEYEEDRINKVKSGNTSRIKMLEDASKAKMKASEIQEKYKKAGGNIEKAGDYIREHRTIGASITDIIEYERSRCSEYVEKSSKARMFKSRFDSDIKRHRIRLNAVEKWAKSMPSDEAVQRYNKEFGAKRFLKQKEASRPKGLTVKELIDYERVQGEMRAEKHVKRGQILHDLNNNRASSVEMLTAYKSVGGRGYEKNAEKKITVENLIAYEKNRLNSLTGGHLERLNRLESVSKEGASEKQIRGEYAHMGAGKGFNKQLQKNAGAILSPEKLLKYESTLIEEKGDKHTERITMLKSMETKSTEEVQKAYYESRMEDRTKKTGGASGISSRVNSVEDSIGIKKKGGFEKIKDAELEQFIEPEQIVKYEEDHYEDLVTKHKERFNMLMNLKKEKVSDEEARKKYEEVAGKGFKQAHKQEISKTKENMVKAGEGTKYEDVENYEKSRVAYYTKRMEQLNEPLMQTEAGIEKIKGYSEKCEKILTAIGEVKQKPEDNLDKFLMILNENGKLSQVEAERTATEENYGKEALKGAVDAVEKIKEEAQKEKEEGK